MLIVSVAEYTEDMFKVESDDEVLVINEVCFYFLLDTFLFIA